MNAKDSICELVRVYLSDLKKFDGVAFIDELLQVTCEIGSVHCSFADDRHLRFWTADEQPWKVELVRAKCIVRWLCARLSVLCNESGGQNVNVYGGEGEIVKARVPALAGAESGADLPLYVSANGIPNADEPVSRFYVHFLNTTDYQEFTIEVW